MVPNMKDRALKGRSLESSEAPLGSLCRKTGRCREGKLSLAC